MRSLIKFRKKHRVCEDCEHVFVPEEEMLRCAKLLKLMIAALFLSKSDKSKKELIKINKKLQKIAKGLDFDETTLRLKYLDLNKIYIDEDEIRKEVLKFNPKIKKDENKIKKEVELWVENKKQFIKSEPEKYKEQLLKQSRKDKTFIYDNQNYLIELVFELMNALGEKTSIDIVNEEGKSERITSQKLDDFQTEIIMNQAALKQYDAIYNKEIIIVREMLKEEEIDEEENSKDLASF